MPKEQTTAQNPAPEINPKSAWRVAEVKALDHYVLWLRFLDGTSGDIDLTPMIFGPDAGVFIALKEKKLFEQAYVQYGAVTWPGELDLAPDALYKQIKIKPKN